MIPTRNVMTIIGKNTQTRISGSINNSVILNNFNSISLKEFGNDFSLKIFIYFIRCVCRVENVFAEKKND